jgi:hypothetical protein
LDGKGWNQLGLPYRNNPVPLHPVLLDHLMCEGREERRPAVERQTVESSLIRSVGYDLFTSILEVELGDERRLYQYFDVPYSIYCELMEADSKGAYFNESIKDSYAYQEVKRAPASTNPPAAADNPSGPDPLE